MAHLCAAYRAAQAGQPAALGAAREAFVRSAVNAITKGTGALRIAVACPVWHVDGRPVHDEDRTAPSRGHSRPGPGRPDESLSQALVGAHVSAIEFDADASAADCARWLDALAPAPTKLGAAAAPSGVGSTRAELTDRLWSTTVSTIRCHWGRGDAISGSGAMLDIALGEPNLQASTPDNASPRAELARTGMRALASLPADATADRERIVRRIPVSLRQLLGAGELRAAMQIWSSVDRSPHLAGDQRQAIESALDEFATAEWLEGFLDEAEGAEFGALSTWLLRMPRDALEKLVTSRKLLTHPTLRPALETLCQLTPEPFEAAFEDEDQSVVTACLGLRLATGLSACPDRVSRAMQRLDSPRRRQLLGIPAAAANDAVLAACIRPVHNDADALTLRRACELVTDPAGPRTVAALLECLVWTGSSQQPPRELQRTLRPIAQALAAQRDAAVLDRLELVLCAGGPAGEAVVSALARSTTAESRALLVRCAKSGSPAARARCTAALGMRVVGRQRPDRRPDQQEPGRQPRRQN